MPFNADWPLRLWGERIYRKALLRRSASPKGWPTTVCFGIFTGRSRRGQVERCRRSRKLKKSLSDPQPILEHDEDTHLSRFVPAANQNRKLFIGCIHLQIAIDVRGGRQWRLFPVRVFVRFVITKQESSSIDMMAEGQDAGNVWNVISSPKAQACGRHGISILSIVS
jgi:hypothetical protein